MQSTWRTNVVSINCYTSYTGMFYVVCDPMDEYKKVIEYHITSGEVMRA